MIQDPAHPGIWLPAHVPLDKWAFSWGHVHSIEWSLANLPKGRRRVAFQAGGNIGLWPKRMSSVFTRVITCEPDAISRECLRANTPKHVEVHGVALGDAPGFCNVKRSSTGSHRIVDIAAEPVAPEWVEATVDKPWAMRVVEGVPIRTIDSFRLPVLDFLQLDIEGYEWHALTGARETIARCRPALIQVELRQHTTKYEKSPELVRELLSAHGYREVSRQRGQDYVFAPWPQN